MQPLFAAFKHIIITSGTLSLDLYPKLLQFHPLVAKSICIDRNSHLCPVVVSRGNDQVLASLSSPCRDEWPSQTRWRFKTRSRRTPWLRRAMWSFPASTRFAPTIKSLCRMVIAFPCFSCKGSLLVEMARVVPDGIICFFTSYSHISWSWLIAFFTIAGVISLWMGRPWSDPRHLQLQTALHRESRYQWKQCGCSELSEILRWRKGGYFVVCRSGTYFGGCPF